MSNVVKARVQWVDVVKFVCIMVVMLSHLEAKTDFLSALFTPFFLNGFFFASGYVYKYKDGFKTFFVKKIKGLLWPWFFFSVLDILLSHIISFNSHMPLKEELMWNLFQIRGMHDGLWFIAALFVAFIPFYFFIKKYDESQKDKTALFILLASSFMLSFLSRVYSGYMNPKLLPWGTYHLPWHIESIFVAMFWMVLGYLFKEKFESVFDEKIKLAGFLIILSICLLMIYIPFFTNYEIPNKVVNYLYSYIKEFLSVLSLIYVCKRIKPNKYNLFVGQNTIIFFALHGKVYSLMQTVFKKVSLGLYTNILSNVITSSLFAIVFAIVLSIVLIIPVYIINTYFPFLVGRTKK